MPQRPSQHKGAKRGTRAHVPAIQRAQRYYSLSGSMWLRLRAVVLREQPICAVCATSQRAVASVDVDHVDGDPNNNMRDNLQGLCRPCHAAKTAREVNAKRTVCG